MSDSIRRLGCARTPPHLLSRPWRLLKETRYTRLLHTTAWINTPSGSGTGWVADRERGRHDAQQWVGMPPVVARNIQCGPGQVQRQVRRRKRHVVREDKYAHSMHKTARAAAAVTATGTTPAPMELTIHTGAATNAIRSSAIGTALGRAKLSVHPIHLICLGTITRGSALQ
jgi:hypothetical protein